VWHTTAVRPPAESHTAERYLALAHAIGLPPAPPRAEFFPSDASRTRMTERLVDEMGWLGDVPLVILHPGGGTNPAYPDERKRWPPERFARLANHLARRYQAKILVVGDEIDKPYAAALVGMVSGALLNLAGRTTLGELGALGEVASLYVGNDTGTTHVAAAVGCPVIAIYGVDAPDQIRPYTAANLITLWQPYEGAFSWAQGVTAEEAMRAADTLLGS
jgi:heptosyltransferase-2